MWASIEKCEGGYLIELRFDRTPNFMAKETADVRVVKTNYIEAEKILREAFIGKPTIEDHGKPR